MIKPASYSQAPVHRLPILAHQSFTLPFVFQSTSFILLQKRTVYLPTVVLQTKKQGKKQEIMNSKNKKKVIVINAILFAVLFGLVSLNKEFLRPTFNNSNLLKILTGCFPNFIAAYLISLASVSAVLIRKFKHGRLIVYTFSIAVFTILMIEEIKPMWGASTYYDTYDIIASGVGSVLAIVTYELLILIDMRRKRKMNGSHYNIV